MKLGGLKIDVHGREDLGTTDMNELLDHISKAASRAAFEWRDRGVFLVDTQWEWPLDR
jgi:hypothetical protein